MLLNNLKISSGSRILEIKNKLKTIPEHLSNHASVRKMKRSNGNINLILRSFTDLSLSNLKHQSKDQRLKFFLCILEKQFLKCSSGFIRNFH